jgi:predicted NAD/FAD-binding protein
VAVVAGGRELCFDRVVIATHADQALGLLAAPTDAERDLLSAWRYAANDTWLHSDERLLPPRSATWSAWNYRVGDCRQPEERATATYGLNRLQRLEASTQYMVTLNPSRLPSRDRVIARMRYRHPMMTPEATATWPDLAELNGRSRVSFCGAYFGYGFHEDGLRSAAAVAAELGGDAP